MIRLVFINKSKMTKIISHYRFIRHKETMNQNDGLIKFGQSILWSMAMLKSEITFIVTMVNRMLHVRSLHGYIMEKNNTLMYNGQARFPCFFRSISKFRTRNKAPL